MSSKTQFTANEYENKIRKVIPYYDEIPNQIFSVIDAYFGEKEISLLDTGCGSGIFAQKAVEKLHLSKLVLCDPSENMLKAAEQKLNGKQCEFRCIGSEQLDYEEEFDVITAIQSHHYFKEEERENAVKNCFRALKNGGIFIYFENTASFTETGRDITLKRVEKFGLNSGRTEKEVSHHTSRYNTEYFPITAEQHIELLRKTGFCTVEMLWYSYLQSGYYGIKQR